MIPKNNSPADNQPVDANPQVSYSEGGRSGTIHYVSTETSFDLWYEFAMPPAIVIIGIPEPRFWEAQTKTPLSQRINILQFIGDQAIKDRLLGDGYLLIEYNNCMTIYSGRNPDAD